MAAVPLEGAVEELREVWRSLAEVEGEEGEGGEEGASGGTAPAAAAAALPGMRERAAEGGPAAVPAEAEQGGAAALQPEPAGPAAPEAISEVPPPAVPAAQLLPSSGEPAGSGGVMPPAAPIGVAAATPAPAEEEPVPLPAMQPALGGSIPTEEEPHPFKPAAGEAAAVAPAESPVAGAAPKAPATPAAGSLPPAPVFAPSATSTLGRPGAVTVERISAPPQEGSPKAGSKSLLGRLLHI